MPIEEILTLRKAGQLELALEMARQDLLAEPENLDLKKALAWVLHDYLKQHTESSHIDIFTSHLQQIYDVNLVLDDKQLINQLPWLIGKIVFEFVKHPGFDVYKIAALFDVVAQFEFTKPSKGYSFLFKGFHKGLKESPKYTAFVDWWDLNYFLREDYKGSKPDALKPVISIAEQAYTTYANLLYERRIDDPDHQDSVHDIRGIKKFLPKLGQVINRHSDFEQAAYQMARLLLAIGKENNPLSALLPFAIQRQTEYWVWGVVADAFDDPDKQLAFLSKAVLCRSRDTDLLYTKLRLVEVMVAQKNYSEAKAELLKIENICKENNIEIPDVILEMMEQEWFGSTEANPELFGFYKHYAKMADAIVFGDIPEETIVVEMTNPGKKILNFVQSTQKQGFFKYGRFLRYVNPGDVLKVRMQETNQPGRYNVFTLKKVRDEEVEGVLIAFYGTVVNKSDKPFGFVNNMFITPDLYTKNNLYDGAEISGKAIISYNRKKEEWGWKVIDINSVGEGEERNYNY